MALILRHAARRCTCYEYALLHVQILLYNDSIFVAASNPALSPGVGVHLIATVGSQPTSGLQSETLITADTATNAFYGSGAITTSFAFEDKLTVRCEARGAIRGACSPH